MRQVGPHGRRNRQRAPTTLNRLAAAQQVGSSTPETTRLTDLDRYCALLMDEAEASLADTRGANSDWLELPSSASCGVGKEPFHFRHPLAGHAAFSTEALIRLCETVPRAWISNRRADRDIVSPHGGPGTDDRPPVDVIRDLANAHNWLIVHHLEHVAPYTALLDKTVDAVTHAIDRREGKLLDRGAVAFAASPRAVVPVHIDRHHNFLLQITGTKEFVVGHFDTPAVQARELARAFGPNASSSHHVPTQQTVFRLGPGDGVYIPANAFHWVRGGSETSVAFSCAFRTERTETAELANEFDAALRRLGLPLRTPRGATLDGLKASVVRLRRGLREQRTRS